MALSREHDKAILVPIVVCPKERDTLVDSSIIHRFIPQRTVARYYVTSHEKNRQSPLEGRM